jgi:hypothetical protein
MLLAVQYAVQPRLSKRYISPKLNKQSVALVEEVVKTGLAAAVFCSKPSDVVQVALKGETLRRFLNLPDLFGLVVFETVGLPSLDDSHRPLVF